MSTEAGEMARPVTGYARFARYSDSYPPVIVRYPQRRESPATRHKTSPGGRNEFSRAQLRARAYNARLWKHCAIQRACLFYTARESRVPFKTVTITRRIIIIVLPAREHVSSAAAAAAVVRVELLALRAPAATPVPGGLTRFVRRIKYRRRTSARAVPLLYSYYCNYYYYYYCRIVVPGFVDACINNNNSIIQRALVRGRGTRIKFPTEGGVGRPCTRYTPAVRARAVSAGWRW